MTRPTPAMLGALATAFHAHGVTERADRLRLCRDHVGRHISSTKALTADEVSGILDRLKPPPGQLDLQARLKVLRQQDDDLAAVRAKLSRGRARRCGNDGVPLNSHDQAMVDDFAERLAYGEVRQP